MRFIKWIISLSMGIVLNALANILIKYAMSRVSLQQITFGAIVKVILNPFLIFGITSFALALAAYSYSLSKYELSVAYPLMTSLGLVIVALTSFLFFKEPFGIQKLVGTLIIILGVVLVARS